MFIVLGNTWALMLGMMLLMVGNGLQGTLIGIRGELEGFSTIELSVVMSAYFVGFLGASRLVPELIRRCLLYTSPSPRDVRSSRMPSSA